MDISNLIITTISSGITLNIFIFLIITYKKYRYPSLKFFLASSIFLILNETLSFFAIFIEDPSFGLSAFLGYFDLLIIVWALYSIVLFFKTFWYENPLDKVTIVLGLLITFYSSATIIVVLLFAGLQNTIFSGFSNIYEIQTLVNPNEEIQIIIFISLIASISGLASLFFSMMFIEKQLYSRIKTSKDENIKKVLNRMRYGNWILIIGLIILLFSEIIGFAILTLGYATIFLFYLRGGIFILQEETLRKLIIMDSAGILKYSYEFRKFASKQGKRDEDADLLFSGALKAISSLLGELTGSDQELREIHLDKITLLVGSASNRELSMVLMVDNSTKFFRDAFNKVLSELPSTIGQFEDNATFDLDTSVKLDSLIQNRFGLD
jgi:hypothetical protein